MNNLVEKAVNSIDIAKITDKMNGDQVLKAVEVGMMLFSICILAKAGGDFTLTYKDASLSYTAKRNCM